MSLTSTGCSTLMTTCSLRAWTQLCWTQRKGCHGQIRLTRKLEARRRQLTTSTWMPQNRNRRLKTSNRSKKWHYQTCTTEFKSKQLTLRQVLRSKHRQSWSLCRQKRNWSRITTRTAFRKKSSNFSSAKSNPRPFHNSLNSKMRMTVMSAVTETSLRRNQDALSMFPMILEEHPRQCRCQSSTSEPIIPSTASLRISTTLK